MKTALITGANKGIGFETARQLLLKDYTVILSARNERRGNEALKKLSNIGSRIYFLRMDVSSDDSIKQAAKEFSRLGLSLDVLVNNAAVLIDDEKIDKVTPTILLETFKTNTLGPILVIQNFLPYMNTQSRIINVSSGYGSITEMSDSPPAYSISKAALNSATRLFSSGLSEKDISINSVSPGWVRTDMGGEDATRSLEKGAETIVWLADEAPHKVNNKFIRDKKEISW
jgi:NAD(P)-dependent dehydrogenase (short-subunit alcohol dehydrogenase family)